MLKIGFYEKEAIKVLVRNTLDRLAKKLDPSVGCLNYFLNTSKDAEEACVVVSFENNEKVTSKDEKLITRELRDVILKSYKIKLVVTCLVPKVCERYNELTAKIADYHETPVPITQLIDRDTLNQVLQEMLKGDLPEVQAQLRIAIDEFLHLAYDKNYTFHPASLRKIFTELLWPDLDLAIQHYPDQAGDMSRMSCGVIDYAHRVMHDVNTTLAEISEAIRKTQCETPEVFAMISHLKATCKQIPLDNPDLAEILNLPINEDSIKRVSLLLEETKTAIQITAIDRVERDLAYRHGLRMLNLLSKLSYYARSVIQQDKVAVFCQLFGDEWFCFNSKQNPEFYQKIFDLFSERFTNYALVNTCLENSCIMYSQLQAILTVQLGQITHKWQVLEANRVRVPIEIKPKELRSALERHHAEMPDVPPMPITTTHISYATENARAESIKLSQQLEERKREKLLAKQSRIFSRLRSESPVVIEHEISQPDDMYTLLVTTSEGQIHEVDISPLRKAQLNDSYFRFNEDSLLLITGSPIEDMLDEPLRQILLASDGRGFLAEASKGETGVKLCKQAKRESFAVIKGREELRIVCARKKLTRQHGASDLEIFVPMRAFPNHHAYEQFINQSDAALRLRQELEKKMTIIEVETHYTPSL